MIRRTNIDPSKTDSGSKVTSEEEDARLCALRDDPVVRRSFVQALFGPLYEVFDSTVSGSY